MVNEMPEIPNGITIKRPKKKADADTAPEAVPPTYYERFLAGRALPTAKELRLTYLPPTDAIILSLHDAGGILVGAFYVDKPALVAIKEGLVWLDTEKAKLQAKT